MESRLVLDINILILNPILCKHLRAVRSNDEYKHHGCYLFWSIQFKCIALWDAIVFRVGCCFEDGGNVLVFFFF